MLARGVVNSRWISKTSESEHEPVLQGDRPARCEVNARPEGRVCVGLAKAAGVTLVWMLSRMWQVNPKPEVRSLP